MLRVAMLLVLVLWQISASPSPSPSPSPFPSPSPSPSPPPSPTPPTPPTHSSLLFGGGLLGFYVKTFSTQLPLIGYGEVDPVATPDWKPAKSLGNYWSPRNISGPAYSVGNFFDGVVWDLDENVLFFSGRFVDASDSDTLRDEYYNSTLTANLIKCDYRDKIKTKAGMVGCCENVLSASGLATPNCPSIPAIASFNETLAVTCNGPPSFLSPDVVTANFYDTITKTWTKGDIPCDTYAANDAYSCNCPKVWRLEVPLSKADPDHHPDYRHFLFLTEFSNTKTFNLVYYDDFSSGWYWRYLLPSNNFLHASISTTDVTQNYLNGDLFIAGTFLLSKGRCHIYYYDATLQNGTCADKNLKQEPLTIDVFSNSEDQQYLLVITGDRLKIGNCTSSLGFYSSFQSNEQFCLPTCLSNDELLACLNLDPTHPLVAYVVFEDVPLPENTYLSSFTQPWGGKLAFAVVNTQEPLLPYPPYMIGYQQGFGWSDPSYPTGINSTDYCPSYSCSISIVDAGDRPPHSALFGNDAIVMTSSDKDFVQHVSRVAVEIIPPTPPPSSACSSSTIEVPAPTPPLSPVMLPNIPVFTPILVHYGQLDFISTRILLPLQNPSDPSITPLDTTLIAGSFRNFDVEELGRGSHRNIAVLRDDTWQGVGIDQGIQSGAVFAVVQWENKLIVGGHFEIANGLANLVQIDDCTDSTCSTSEWKTLCFDSWVWSDQSVVTALAVYDDLLFIGGGFTLHVENESIDNFLVFNLTSEKIVYDEGFDQGDVETNGKPCVSPKDCTCINTFQIVNHELWIGGFFQNTKSNSNDDDEDRHFTSIARFDISKFSWEPITGVLKGNGSPGTLNAIHFYSNQTSTYFSYPSPNNNQIETAKDIFLFVSLGGEFAMPDSYFTSQLFNFAMTCLIVSDDSSFLPTGVLKSRGVLADEGKNYYVGATNQSVTKESCETNYSRYMSAGGPNGPIYSITTFNGANTDGPVDELIIAGSFANIQGRLKTIATECPIMRFYPQEEKWSLLGSSYSCYGSIYTLTTTPYVDGRVLIDDKFVWSLVAASVLVMVLVVGLLVLYCRKKANKRQIFVPVTSFTINSFPYDNETDTEDKPLIKLWGEREREQTLEERGEKRGSDFFITEKINRLHPYRFHVDPILRDGENKRSKKVKSPHYKITVECGVSEWAVKRKYCDFVVLHNILQLNYPTVMFPKLPTKQAESKKDFFQMAHQLKKYLKSLLDCTFTEKLSKMDESQHHVLQADLSEFLVEGQVLAERDKYWKIDIGDIEIQRRSGTGSFAEVYKGSWKGVDVAAKIFRPSIAANEKLVTEFRAETSLMTKLHHQNILTFYGSYCKPPNLCIVTEWMSRGSLYEIIHSQKSQYHSFPLGFRMKLAHDVSKGVAYLHNLSVIHRDLKSLNLLVDENWTVKVADFGMAKVKEFFEETQTTVGTPAWTAPEVLRGEKYDERADVYSFGIVIWELLTGQVPFKGYKYKIMRAVCDEGERPPIPENEDQEVINLMTCCWADERDNRPSFKEICGTLADIMLRLNAERPHERVQRTKREEDTEKKEKGGDLVFDIKNQMMVKREETSFSLIFQELREMFTEGKGEEEDKKWDFPGSGNKEEDLVTDFSEETRLAFRSVSYSWSDKDTESN